MRREISDVEWSARVDLAAMYRLVALHGWDDMIFTHITARVPGDTPAFLINPYDRFFDEMRASDFALIDLDGNPLAPCEAPVNRAGFVIHSAIHAAREDAHFVIHLHADHGVAVSAQAGGLLPLTQHALYAIPTLAYHDYEGIAVNLDERERLVRDLGDRMMMMLRNHGTLAVGATAAEAWGYIYHLERACRQQVLALTAGAQGVLAAPDEAQQAVARQINGKSGKVYNAAWPACLRMLDRRSPGYDV